MPDDWPTIEPTPREKPKPTLPYDKPVPVPPRVSGKVTLAEKIVLPARTSLAWDAARHFLYGAIYAGGGALAAFATAGALAIPAAWPIIGGCAVAGGAIDAYRKTRKTQTGGKDWTDIIYKVLELIIDYLKSRGGKK